ncbi:aldehyde dehydrogenase family protein [Paraburkholderia caribensis]|uniref:Aldehyde dehydrogenase n=1 Tax=Paraburkholderia caribensis TaxID=75105 RepID=A0A9Q6SAQ5_9BURK|nr:aldehyde dehydrogenase family protein [Paraburkholderia caribensis]ALP67912.1 aldehyde dehydrogenase [Paraburkholderia caribensis]AUT56119.1 aldehyde dehydrogenase [Paraburkholderia caribensis]MCO4876397.1 aldehyde dehydrogenase family protein [Paraburkholderia caribensis]PTB26988.1 aldehyde dehydrogenase [Paraburkholderia caribensis]QLB67566.1 aldehyde dehydrogenase [Paraburkholderia caribensis]
MSNNAEDLLVAFQHFFPQAKTIGSYVGGELVEGAGETIQLFDAATGEKSIAYKDGGAAVVEQAAAAAVRAQKQWWALTHAARGRVMFEIARQVRAEAEALARLESLGSGKPIRDCRGEVAKVAEMFEYYGGWADKFYGEVIPVPTSHLNYTRREPAGTVLQITPWNAPVFTCGWQVAPAISMGNAVLLKPSELTPTSSIVIGLLCERAGAPKGLVNVLAGLGQTVAQSAIAHKAIKKVVFVGSPATGARIAEAAAKRVLPCVLELGGKSANIIFGDADLKRAALTAQAAIFAGAGQSCVAGSRLLVQRSVYDDFVAMVATGARKIKVGQPLDDSTEVGPINNRRQYEHVMSMIDKGVAAGATLASGSQERSNAGYFVSPTVLSNVTNDMAVAREEIFGPVVAAIPFDTEDEAIAIANDTEFGLAGAVWTTDVARSHRVAAQVNAGTFWVNGYKTINVASPFGGFGLSGYGRSSGVEALYEYTQTKSVWVETAKEPPTAFGYL